MKVAVLGSRGQIGRHLVTKLKAAGHHVIGQDITTGIDLRYEWGLEPVDLVYFLAFDVGGSRYLAERQKTFDYIDGNMKLMENVFSHLHKYAIPFIFASSQMSNMLESSYGVLKSIGEHYTRSLNGINIRLWNVYGKEHDPAKFHVITDFLVQVKDQQCIRMLTDGQEVRQFLHADDCSSALITLAERYAELDPFVYYDITSFEWVSIYEVAHIIADLYPGTTVIPGTKTDQTQTVMNEPTDVIFKYWKPTISLIEGIRSMGS